MNSFLRNVGFYLLVIFVAITAYDYFSVKPQTVEETSYSQFLQRVDEGEVTKVVLTKNSIKATKKDGTEFTTIAPDSPIGDESLVGKLAAVVDDAPFVLPANIDFNRRMVLHNESDARVGK